MSSALRATLDRRQHERALEPASAIVETRALTVWAGRRPLVRDVNVAIPPGRVFALIGPSGAGKSTLLRCLNRLTDLSPSLRVTGDVVVHGRSTLTPGTDVDALRSRIGMLFQQPVVFPATVYQNVIFGVRHLGQAPRREWPNVAERALREVALWSEVKDRLHAPAVHLSVGQRQRLCLARTLAVGPEIILMDEPTSALDPQATEAIEGLILGLKARRTIVLVTHDLGQARRVADWVACVCIRDGVGEVVETACCDELFTNPRCREAAEYLGKCVR